MSLAIRKIGTAVPDTVIDQADALVDRPRDGLPDARSRSTWLPGMYAGTLDRHAGGWRCAADVVRDVIDGTQLSGSVFLPEGRPGRSRADDRPSGWPTTSNWPRRWRWRPAATRSPARASSRRRSRTSSPSPAPASSRRASTTPSSPAWACGRPSSGRTSATWAATARSTACASPQAFASDPRARVLLCAVELCSLHYHYSYNPSKMIANAIFGDGAAAVVGVGAASPRTARPPGASWRPGSCYLPELRDGDDLERRRPRLRDDAGEERPVADPPPPPPVAGGLARRGRRRPRAACAPGPSIPAGRAS